MSIIQQLVRYYDNDPNSAPMGWSDRRATYEIVIRSDGSLVGINPLGDKKNPRFMRVPTVPSRTSGIVPACLYEKADYTLGRKEKAHKASVRSHNLIPKAIDGIEAVQTFLASANTLKFNVEQQTLGSVDINLGKIGGIGILRLSETKEGPQDEPVRNPRFAMECHQRPYAWAHRYERGYRQG